MKTLRISLAVPWTLLLLFVADFSSIAVAQSTVTYQYDLNNRVQTATYSGGNSEMTYGYDDTGNVLSVTTSGSAPPAIGINGAVANETVGNAAFTFTGSASATATAIYYQINGGAWQLASGSAAWQISLDLSPGNNTISVYAVDGSGLDSDTNTFSVDYQPNLNENVAGEPLFPPWASLTLLVLFVAVALGFLRWRKIPLGPGMHLLLMLLIAWSALGCLSAHAQDDSTNGLGPGWYFLDGASNSVDFSDGASNAPGSISGFVSANGFTGPITTSYISGQPVMAETITPEITDLAQNLENNPARIYDYVHNYIQYLHYFGSRKGALMTLLEGSGNDFDQCALLAALLRAAAANLGQSWTITYQFGIMPIPYQDPNNTGADIQHWLGLNGPGWPVYFNQVNVYNNSADYPNYNSSGSAFFAPVLASDNNTFVFHRAWLKLVDGNGTHYLDPAFKIYDAIGGINLDAATQMNPATLLNQAQSGGATVTADYVQNLNWSALASTLTQWTANFLADLEQTHPNYSVSEVLSGYAVRQTATPSEQAFPGLPYGPVTSYQIWTSGGSIGLQVPVLEWDNIPSNYMARIELKVDNLDVTYSIPALKAAKLSLTFANNQAVISLGDVVTNQGAGGSGTNATMTTTIWHPAGSWNYTTNGVALSGTDYQSDLGKHYNRTAPGYVIAYGFGDPGKRLARSQQRLALLRQTLAANAPAVVTESLQVVGLTWMMEAAQSQNVLAGPLGVIPLWYNLAGRVAQESPTATGFYVDLRLVAWNYLWRSGQPGAAGDPSVNTFAASAFISSAMEHGVLEQLQGVLSASTVKCLYQSCTNHQKLILGTVNNYSTVSSLLASETIHKYKATDKAALLSNLTNGVTMLMTSGSNLIDSWGGYGYAKGFTSSSGTITAFLMGISDSLSGGFEGDPTLIDSDPIIFLDDTSPLADNPAPSTQILKTGADPVRMVDGAFTVDAVDLSNGQADPRGLTFAHHYDSKRLADNSAGMAPGWTHNYIIQANVRSDPGTGLGEIGTQSTPQAMAAFATGMRAAYEVFCAATNQQPSLCWAATALAAKWAFDQLESNAVSIVMGSQTIQFNKQPDGSFTPPAGLSMTLTQPNGYLLQQRHGNAFSFDPVTQKVTSISNLYGLTSTFTYSGTNLQTVKDCWQRSLTFGYTAGRLASVTDGTRTVSFYYGKGFNPNYDLTSITDADTNWSFFGYDSNHQLTETYEDDAYPIVENFYDANTNGVVTTQWSQGESTKASSFFISGPVNVQVDPLGGRTVYYYDEDSRLTTVSDALGNTNYISYDGQDHVIQRVSPLGETWQYAYDGQNNLTQVIDPLQYTNTFLYDGNDNLRTNIDALGNQTSYTYNPQFQVLTITAPNANNESSMPVVTSFYYDPNKGNLLTKTDPDAKVFTYSYDTWGMLWGILYPNQDQETFVNNAFGQMTSHVDGNHVTTAFTYNGLGQMLTKTVQRVAGNVVTRNIYDFDGNLATSFDANTNATSYVYTTTHKLLTTTLPLTAAGTGILYNGYDLNPA